MNLNEDESNGHRASFGVPTPEHRIDCFFDKDYVIVKSSPPLGEGQSTFHTYAINRPVYDGRGCLKLGEHFGLGLLRIFKVVADYADYKDGLLVCGTKAGQVL